MDVLSLFSGCGGLDLGFHQAGFNIIWANEYDKSIWDTYEFNHPQTKLDRRYIRIIRDKKPLFFLAENVSGILAEKHTHAFTNILHQFKEAGYEISCQLLNAKNFNVPQDRKRIIIVGYREDLGGCFEFPQASPKIL